eukprot:gene17936-34587_t
MEYTVQKLDVPPAWVDSERRGATKHPTNPTRAKVHGWEVKVLVNGANTVANVIATGSWDNTTKIWNTANGECTATLTGHANATSLTMGGGGLGWHPTLPMIVSAEWHPMLPNIYATGSGDKTCKVWDTVRLWKIPELFNPFWKFTHRLVIPPLARTFIHFVMLVGEAMNRKVEVGVHSSADSDSTRAGDELEVARGHGQSHANPLPPHLWLYILTFIKVRELRFHDSQNVDCNERDAC